MANDYSNLGLNNKLQSTTGLISRLSDYTSAMDFDIYTEAVRGIKLGQGVFKAQLDIGIGVGGAYVRLDGQNNRIVVNDGTNNRIVIGSVA